MKEKLLAVIFTLFAVWVQGALLFQNGVYDRLGNLNFYDMVALRDVTVHLSLVQELLNRFPPTNFAAGGAALKNYHYFFDVFLSVFARVPGISLLDLYFRITPVVLSICLCAAIYFATRQLTKNKLAPAFAIFFTIMSTSFGPIVPFIADFFKLNHVIGAGNTFMTDQIFSMMVNPQGISSLIIYLCIFLSLCWYDKTKKAISLFVVFILISISFGVKAYGGILFAPAALLTAIYFLVKNKDWRLFLAVVSGLFAMLLWFLYSIDSKVAGLSVAPFWLLGRMMSDFDRLNQPAFAPLLDSFVLQETWWRVGVLVLGEFLIFFVGNLGLRILGLFSIPTIVKKWKKITTGEMFLYLVGLASLFLPLFFNQTSKAYEVIQFFPYFTLLTGIIFTLTLFSLLERKNILITAFVLSLFVLAFLVLDKRELDQKIKGSSERIVIPAGEMAAATYIRLNTSPSAIFLLAPSNFNSDYLWFTSVTGRRTVYAGQRFDQQIGVDTNKLSQKVQDYFAGKNTDLKYDYIFTSQTLDGGSAMINQQKNLKVVFEENGAKVYKYEP